MQGPGRWKLCPGPYCLRVGSVSSQRQPAFAVPPIPPMERARKSGKRLTGIKKAPTLMKVSAVSCGVREIRTPEPLLTVTRFPAVLQLEQTL